MQDFDEGIVFNKKLLLFHKNNYQLHYLSSRYHIRIVDTGVCLIDQASDDAIHITGSGTDLFEFFGALLNGKSYTELLLMIPSCVEDKEGFLAELWQKGVIL